MAISEALELLQRTRGETPVGSFHAVTRRHDATRRAAELERVNLERQKLLVGLVHAQETERSRMADDGVGFKPDEGTMYRPGHLGLASIRERATAAGGRFELESAPGAGCVVEVWVPHSFAAQ